MEQTPRKSLPLRVPPELYDRIRRLCRAPHGKVPVSQIVNLALESGVAQLEAQARPTIPLNTQTGPVAPLETRGPSDAA